MLNKNNLRIAKIARDVTSRYNLDSIKITPTETIATDGHLLMRVTRPETGEGEFLLRGELALEVAGAIDENQYVAAGLEGEGVKVSFGDEERQHGFTQKIRPDKFPNYDKVMPEGEPIAEIAVNADYFIKILKLISKAQNTNVPIVLISIYGADKPVRFDAKIPYSDQKICALVMPLKEFDATQRDYPTKEKTEVTS